MKIEHIPILSNMFDKDFIRQILTKFEHMNKNCIFKQISDQAVCSEKFDRVHRALQITYFGVFFLPMTTCITRLSKLYQK